MSEVPEPPPKVKAAAAGEGDASEAALVAAGLNENPPEAGAGEDAPNEKPPVFGAAAVDVAGAPKLNGAEVVVGLPDPSEEAVSCDCFCGCPKENMFPVAFLAAPSDSSFSSADLFLLSLPAEGAAPMPLAAPNPVKPPKTFEDALEASRSFRCGAPNEKPDDGLGPAP